MTYVSHCQPSILADWLPYCHDSAETVLLAAAVAGACVGSGALLAYAARKWKTEKPTVSQLRSAIICALFAAFLGACLAEVLAFVVPLALAVFSVIWPGVLVISVATVVIWSRAAHK